MAGKPEDGIQDIVLIVGADVAQEPWYMTFVLSRPILKLKSSHEFENQSKGFWSSSSLCETRAASLVKRN